MPIWQSIWAELSQGKACVLVSIAAGAGSTPRDAGARMVVLADGAIKGTIGGGHLEFQAHRFALDLLKQDGERVFVERRFSLGPDLGQCCGGRADISLEVLTADQADEVERLATREAAGGVFTTRMMLVDGVPGCRQVVGDRTPLSNVAVPQSASVLQETFGEERQKLYLFGAGHVGRAVVLALASLPFDIVWIDGRQEMFPERCPRSVTKVCPDNPAAQVASAEPGSFIVVMTHHHGLDEEIVLAALARGTFSYVGLIGSETKRRRFESRLRKKGLGEKTLGDLVCPVGTGLVKSKLPAAIAADLCVQLLERLETLESRQSGEDVETQGLAIKASFGQ